VIGHFSLEWPPPKDNAAQESANQQQFNIFFQKLGEHLNLKAREGARDHQAAIVAGMTFGGNANMLFLGRHFDLPDAAIGFFEDTRRSLHEMSRLFRMRDEDIIRLADAAMEQLEDPEEAITDREWAQTNEHNITVIRGLLRTLRDQYEAGAEPEKEASKLIV
jgi:hypothetical protein